MVGKAQGDKRDDAIDLEFAVAICALCEQAGHQHEERHVEEVDNVEGEAEDRIGVVHGMGDVAEHDEDDEESFEVVEQGDAPFGARCGAIRAIRTDSACCLGARQAVLLHAFPFSDTSRSQS